MTAPDDLKIGQWIAVVSNRIKDAKAGDLPYAPCTGMPIQIKSISFPFLCVANCFDEMDTVDIRVYRVQKLGDHYVKEVNEHIKKKHGSEQDKYGSLCQVDTSSIDRYKCPVCDGPMVQKLIEGHEQWLLVCNECGFGGGLSGQGVIG